MDQVKEFLRQCIKYRFWIAVGVSALLPMIAYFVGVSPIRADTDKKTGEINQAKKDVQQYTSSGLPNGQYKGIVNEKTGVLTQDVTASWKKLYARQAPLLTWPERVESKFKTWGRKWPETVDSSTVQFAIIDYINAYPAEVTAVYQTFHPFDPVEGTGVVAAAPEEALLRPAKFEIDKPPSLGKVWAAQERLWIQRTLLDVVANVNGDAKTWDNALIKQIMALEVGTALAQDQRSIAKGEVLEESAPLDDPAKPPDPDPSAGGPSGMEGMMKSMGGGGGAAVAPETVSHIKPESENVPYTIMPVQLSVLIDQDHVADLLVAMENSPMNIQVKDFELTKPTARVTKPVKGESMMGYGGTMMGGMGGMGGMDGGSMMRMMMGRRGGASGYGGNSMQMQQQMQAQMQMSMMAGNMGGGSMGGGSAPKKVGKNVRDNDREKAAEKLAKAAAKATGNSLHDPYYNIVQVKITGQARFFSPPPPDPEPAPSEAGAPAAEGEKKAEGKAEKKADAPAEAEKKAEGDPPKKDEAEKKAEGDMPKDEAAKKDAPAAKKDEAAKADGDTPKKDEAAKRDAPAAKKDEAAKAEGDTPKKDEAAKAEGDEPKKDDAATKVEPAPKADATPKK
jgi:hypothetical protein